MNDPIAYNVYQPAQPQETNVGYDGALQQFYEESFDPSSGYINRTEYIGLNWNSGVALRNYFAGFGITCVLRNDRGTFTLTLTDATGAYVIDKWEMSLEREQPSVFENQIFLALLANAEDPSGTLTVLRSLLQNADPSSSAWVNAITYPNGNTPGGLLNQQAGSLQTPVVANPPFDHWPLGATFLANGTWLTQLQQFFDDHNRGITNFQRGSYTLRHTTNAPARWGANIADFNTDCIYTISQLLNEVQSPALWIYPLPGYLVYKILNYYIPPPLTNYMWGALKGKSDANTAANNRIDIVTEYQINQINTNLYLTL